MVEIGWIRDGLADRMPSKVAAATGLHVNTVVAIRDGKNSNPTIGTLNKLALYLQRPDIR